MRLFLAIDLPSALRDRLEAVLAPLRTAAPLVSWADVHRIHLTLKFLGEQPDGVLAPLIAALDAMAAGHAAFTLTVSGLGAFPNLHRPRVVWIGVSADPRLELLHHDLEMACEALGFPLDGRPFRPHLTLGRVRDTVPATELRALAGAARQVNFGDTFRVLSIDLLQSQLSARGARYASLHAAPLRSA